MGRGKHLNGKIEGGDEILTHEETLQLLSEMAKAGSVSRSPGSCASIRTRRKTSWTTSLSGSSAAMDSSAQLVGPAATAQGLTAAAAHPIQAKDVLCVSVASSTLLPREGQDWEAELTEA